MKTILYVFFSLAVIVGTQVNAQTQFIKYKKYLIPISSCSPFSAHRQGVPNVYYMNDVGFAADPDGVFDVPIVMAWHKAGLINLVGVGASNPSAADRGLIQTLVDRSVESQYRVTVDAQSQIPNKLISLSESNSCLHIAIGGSWEQLANAITQLESDSAALARFISRVSISGVGSTNIGTVDNEGPLRSGSGSAAEFGFYQKVKNNFTLEENLVRLDRVEFAQSYPNGLSTDLNFGVLNTRAKRRAIDDWFDNNFLDVTNVGRYLRDYGNSNTNFIERNDSKGVRWLLCGNRPSSLGACPSTRWGDKNGRGMKMRIADFNAVAYLIWGVSPNVLDFDSSMKQKLDQAWSYLIP